MDFTIISGKVARIYENNTHGFLLAPDGAERRSWAAPLPARPPLPYFWGFRCQIEEGIEGRPFWDSMEAETHRGRPATSGGGGEGSATACRRCGAGGREQMGGEATLGPGKARG